MINWQIRAAVQFHDVIYGFQAVWGTRNTSLKSKLLQKLTATREEVLYETPLELQKAYVALDREI